MNTSLYSQVHFFDTLKATVVSQPYAILCCEEVNSLIDQIDTLSRDVNAQCAALEQARALRQAVDNAKSDGYFPIVILPAKKYEIALSHLRRAQHYE